MKIEDLSPEIIEQLVALECQNILPILSTAGVNQTEKDIRTQIAALFKSEVVIHEINGVIEGFAIYSIKDFEAKIITFNTKKRLDALVLRSLLSQVAEKLKHSPVKLIKSQAHLTNKISINFHKKLGFQEKLKTETSIKFEVSTFELLSVLNRRI